SSAPPEITLTPAVAAMTADVRPAILLLLAAAGLLLMTSMANVGTLQLSRAITRRRELAVRAALGATRRGVMRQMMLEASLISLSGGAAGFLLVLASVRALPALLPSDFPRTADIGVGAWIVVFTLVLTVATGVVSGLVPAFEVSRVDLITALCEE